MMLPGTDCVFVLRGVPVKRHRGEPGHTRDTRTHKGTGISVDFETDQISVLNTRNTPALRNYEHYVVSGYYVLHMHPRLSGFVFC